MNASILWWSVGTGTFSAPTSDLPDKETLVNLKHFQPRVWLPPTLNTSEAVASVDGQQIVRSEKVPETQSRAKQETLGRMENG